MNRNVMVSHQKACIKAAQNSPSEASSSSLLQQLGTVGATNNQTVLLSSGNQTINNKRPYFKVVLNSDEIKTKACVWFAIADLERDLEGVPNSRSVSYCPDFFRE